MSRGYDFNLWIHLPLLESIAILVERGVDRLPSVNDLIRVKLSHIGQVRWQAEALCHALRLRSIVILDCKRPRCSCEYIDQGRLTLSVVRCSHLIIIRFEVLLILFEVFLALQWRHRELFAL